MEKRRFIMIMALLFAVVAFPWIVDQAAAEQNDNQLRRQEAYERFQKAIEDRQEKDPAFASRLPQLQEASPTVVGAPLAGVPGPYPPGLGFNPLVNYNDPNYANSPNLRKFVDSLPGLGLPGCTPGTGV